MPVAFKLCLFCFGSVCGIWSKRWDYWWSWMENAEKRKKETERGKKTSCVERCFSERIDTCQLTRWLVFRKKDVTIKFTDKSGMRTRDTNIRHLTDGFWTIFKRMREKWTRGRIVKTSVSKLFENCSPLWGQAVLSHVIADMVSRLVMAVCDSRNNLLLHLELGKVKSKWWIVCNNIYFAACIN